MSITENLNIFNEKSNGVCNFADMGVSGFCLDVAFIHIDSTENYWTKTPQRTFETESYVKYKMYLHRIAAM